MKRFVAVSLVVVGLLVIGHGLLVGAGVLLEVLSTGAEPAADRSELQLVLRIIEVLTGISLAVVGVRLARRRDSEPID